MNVRANIGQLDTPQDIARLVSIISEISEELDVLYTETAPNGAISSRIGRMAIYKNGTSYETWQNTDGGTTWKRIDSGAYTSPFQTGDWIVSSVTTARTGWTNVSATYANKMIRVSATPLSTGGADSASITLSEANLPSHTHAAGTLTGGEHTHNLDMFPNLGGSTFRKQISSPYAQGTELTTSSGGAVAVTGSTGSIGSGTAFTVATISAYISACIFQKDA